MLYVAGRYTAEVGGAAIKGAYCENCACEYVYRIAYTASGQGSSPYFLDNDGAKKRAKEAAMRALNTALKGAAAVPCPTCGWYQRNMLPKLGGTYGWLMAGWILGATVSMFCALIGLEPFLYSATITVLMFALWLSLRRYFNPNLKAHTRVDKRPPGAPHAYLRSEIEPQLATMEEDAQDAMRDVFAQIDADKAHAAGAFKATPMDPESQKLADGDRKRRLFLQLAGMTLAGVAAFATIGPISSRRQEAILYKQATSRRLNTRDIDQYLAEFPNGPHAQELRDLRDDSIFERAASDAHATASPQPLRDYLASAANTRHRDEAKVLRRAAYLDAVAKIENRPTTKMSDAAFIGAIVAALKSQADADNPVITLNVIATYDLEPQMEDVKASEARSKELLFTEFPDLMQELKDHPESNRIIPTGDLLQPQVEQTRMVFILGRFQDLIDTAVGTHLVSVGFAMNAEKYAAVPAAAPALIDVKYHVRPLGKLNFFEMTETHGLPASLPSDSDAKRRQAGFLRYYVAEWECNFNVPNFKQQGAIAWASGLDDDFSFQREESFRPAGPAANSEWEIYAAMLHYMTYRAGQTMFQKLGLPAPPISKTFGPHGPQ